MVEPGAAARSGTAHDFYQSFSHEVGLRDWLTPNPRHEQLRLIVDSVLDGCSDARILDVGCGAGVMSAHLTRYGDVLGTDLSEPAVALASVFVPRARFVTLAPADLAPQGPFDLITLFDVLEHVPPADRPPLLRDLADLLADDGRILASTPDPAYGRWVAENHPDALQIIDEPPDPMELAQLAGELGLELTRYERYDIDGARQYQVLVFERARAAGGPPRRRRQLEHRLRRRSRRPSVLTRRLPLALRALRRLGPRTALWVLRPSGPPPPGLRPSSGPD